jgi:hypothetical protein
MDSSTDNGYLVRMIQPISGKQIAVDIAKSTEAMTGVLENAQSQSSRLNEKLIKAGVTEKVQDSALGSNIDITA